jgi:protein tyrosine phosphatase domain-containing protein 1
MLKMVKDMASEMNDGGRVLVHCHAGHGRTGLLIACSLVYSARYSAAEAITLVRLRRAKAIQTQAQADMIKKFAAYLK